MVPKYVPSTDTIQIWKLNSTNVSAVQWRRSQVLSKFWYFFPIRTFSMQTVTTFNMISPCNTLYQLPAHQRKCCAMLTRLNWESRLLMFYKIHNGLAGQLPLDIKLHSVPMHASRKLSGLPHPTVIMWLSPLFFSPALFVTGTFFLKRSSGSLPLSFLGVLFRVNPIYILVLHRQWV